MRANELLGRRLTRRKFPRIEIHDPRGNYVYARYGRWIAREKYRGRDQQSGTLPAKIELETLNIASTVPSHLPVRPALMPGRCSLRAGSPLSPSLPCSPSENVGCRGSRGSRNFHANEAGPSELTTAYLAARLRNRFVRVSDKITAPAYR